MPQLTERQRNLLRFISQLNQNLSDRVASNSLIDFDFDINLGNTPPSDENEDENENEEPPTTSPTSYEELLLSLVNERVELTTPFGTVSGILLNVQNDYVVIVENTGEQVFVRIDKIELVSEL